MKNRQLRNKFSNHFSEQNIEEAARYSKFKIRNSGKLSPLNFISLSCFSSNNLCTSTLEELSADLLLKQNINISPQALDQRFGKASVEFLKNIFLMDSTEIKLPHKLKDKYKGANKSNPAVLKINLLLELLDYSFKNTVLSSGTRNEQTFSKYIYDKLVTDSLVLKDLGYFKFDDFSEIESRNSFFISRLRAGTRLFSLNPNPKYHKNGKIIKKTKYLVTTAGELGNRLKAGETKEYEFLVGSHDNKRPFRIVLTKLDEMASHKRIQMIEGRERRKEHCAKHARNSAEISGYITNLWGSDSSEIIEIYRLRWQIELLFKIFKSDFKLDKLKDLKIERIETHIYATLIRIVLLMEITKGIKGGYPEKISIRRVVKSSLGILNNLLEALKDEEGFVRLTSKLEKIIDSKIKNVPSK
ncbi:IS4 family transposase [uncultured Ilyobacter sp.]|uniref:IS4 family transposase n=1 Tax=uncultured Ilyobacter sp. TaxID=544433 RepID=UPI0029C0CE8F|nr:IS4 family transposase [uncultured Ilyobacter sp.]